jgi:hypothetical protein
VVHALLLLLPALLVDWGILTLWQMSLWPLAPAGRWL